MNVCLTFPSTLSTSSWCGMMIMMMMMMMMIIIMIIITMLMMRRRGRRTVQIIPWQWNNSRLWRRFNWPEHVHEAKKVTSMVGRYTPNRLRWQKHRWAFASFDATPLSHLFLSHALALRQTMRKKRCHVAGRNISSGGTLAYCPLIKYSVVYYSVLACSTLWGSK